MKPGRITTALFALTALFAVSAGAAEQPVFGPVKYEVKERYGRDNRYTATFPADEELYIIKVQNGDQPVDRVELMDLTVNGQMLLREDMTSTYKFYACFVKLRKESSFVLSLRDQKPSGLRRPTLPPRFAYVAVFPAGADVQALGGVFGLPAWEGLAEFTALLLKIKDPEAFALAVKASDVRTDTAQRAEAMRSLADRKAPMTHDFFVRMYSDQNVVPAVRGEAARAIGLLGDVKQVPLLMQGLLDPDEPVAVGSARGLAFFPEEETRDLLAKTLERLDVFRKDAVIKAVQASGWRPVGVILSLAQSKDPHVSAIGIRLLGGVVDARATELLLKLADEPGQNDLGAIIIALGETKDPRAVEPLLRIAKDPEKRRWREVELGEALAKLGDQRAADVIVELIKKAESRTAWDRLREAYKKLTGQEYKK